MNVNERYCDIVDGNDLKLLIMSLMQSIEFP